MCSYWDYARVRVYRGCFIQSSSDFEVFFSIVWEGLLKDLQGMS